MKLSITPMLLFVTICSQAQDIKVFHGTKGTSTIITDPNTCKDGNCKFQEGQKVTLQVINAHPALYNYEFTESESEIEDPELPDLSDLVAALTSASGMKLDSAEKSRVGIRGGSGDTAPKKGQWPDLYKNKIDELRLWITDAEQTIEDSDIPLPLDESLQYSSEGGFLGAKKKLLKNSLFKIENIDKYVENWQNEVKSSGAPYYYKPEATKPEIALLMELYDNYFKTLSVRAKEIRNAYDASVSGTYSYTFTLGTKQKNIKLKVSNKDKKAKHRDIGDSVVVINIVPYYTRPIVELVPMLVVSQSSNGRTFGIENGLITEAQRDAFEFGAGASLNVNLANFGPRKEISFGTGLGFALVNQSLNNLFLNANVNYGSWVRLGVGYGWLQTPTALKNDLKAGDDASNIKDIHEVIVFNREPALFFTLVIPGFNLPVKK